MQHAYRYHITVCDFYQDDFVKDNLQAELKTFGVHFHQNWERPVGGIVGSLTIFDVRDHFLSFSCGQALLLPQVKRLIRLIKPGASRPAAGARLVS